MNKTTVAHKSERGQAIILIVLAVVGMFGFGALALDMGQVYYARRSSQAAADNAALAAAYEAAGGSLSRTDAITKAFQVAAANGFNNDGVTNWVSVKNPPDGNDYCPYCGVKETEEYYQVQITVRNNPIFSHLIFSGVQQTTVKAIAHAQTAKSASAYDAIRTLSLESDSMNLNGDITIKVDGGNIRSLGKMTKNGGSGSVYLTGGGKVFYGTSFDGKSHVFNVAPAKDVITAPPIIEEPWCPKAAETSGWASGTGYVTKKINDVNYYYHADGLQIENLPPGIHCIDLKDPKKNSDAIGKGNYRGDNVLIVLLKGGVQQTGNDSVDFTAANNLKDKNGKQWGGMVVYAPPTNTHILKFGGNDRAYFEGTIYAPAAHCDLAGTSDTEAIYSAIICYTFKIHGNPTLNIKYRPEHNFRMPPAVQLIQ